LPLEGVRVLDLTVALAGPWCTHILGALGAEVIKLEPISGEETRFAGPPFWKGESPLFLAANSNKRSIALELGSPEGRQIALDLARGSDVFVQNLRAGAVEKLGLGFDELRRASPKIVYCTIGAFGKVGPRADRPAYDLVMQAVSGVMSTTGESDGRPLRTGPAVVDLSTGLWAAIGVLSALLADRDEALLVDTSLYESAVNLQPIQFVQYAASGYVAPRLGASGNILVPFETLPTTDGEVVVAAGNDRLFRKLCDAVGLPELGADDRFRDNASRVRNRPQLAAILAERVSTHPSDYWLDILAAAGVPVAGVKDIAGVAADPQFNALGLLAPVPHDVIDDLHVLAPPLSFGGTRAALRSGAPALGADTAGLLLDLGYDEATIGDLIHRKLVRTAPMSSERSSDG
jgi:crotonobetainyl-CoA:carnitine CoA-transferase CaiB-like acyl-CoA transferase